MNNTKAPNFAAVLRDCADLRREEADRIHAALVRWSADVASAVAVCRNDAASSVHYAAKSIEQCPHQISDSEAVVLLGAVFGVIYRSDNLHMKHRQDVLAGISDAVSDLLAEVVHDRELQCEERSKR
jgi:hypothetical protein